MNNEEHEYQPETNYEYQLRVIEEMRKAAYADPQKGSDRLFVEAQRMQMMNEDGWEAVKDQAATRYEEIRTEHPWPEAK